MRHHGIGASGTFSQTKRFRATDRYAYGLKDPYEQNYSGLGSYFTWHQLYLPLPRWPIFPWPHPSFPHVAYGALVAGA